MSDEIDIGHGHTLRFFQWAPDRELNPQYEGLPDVDRAGARVEHPDLRDPSKRCGSAMRFAGRIPDAALSERERQHVWTVESEDPLTLSPSILCRVCGDHGFVREGKWVPA